MNLRSLLRSFKYAHEGLIYVLLTQRNMRIHFYMAFLVCVAALLLKLPKTDILVLMLTVIVVILMEMVNTAIEKVVDLASPEWHQLAKIAKDVAAGAVLISSIFALVVGMVVFYPPLDAWLKQGHLPVWMPNDDFGVWLIWLVMTVVMLFVIGLQVFMARRFPMAKPSLLAALAFAIASLIAWLSQDPRVWLMGYTLALFGGLIAMDRGRSSLISAILGATIGGLLPIVILVAFQQIF
jgi:diacylglycerol kinase